MSPRIASLCAALLVVAAPAHAQFGDLMNRASKQATDAAAKAARDAARPPPVQPAPKEPVSTPAAAKGEADQPATPAAGAPTSAPAGEAYGNRYDFVPGDKVLVFDDFSDTDVGEYPAKWTIKGGGGNSLEVVQVGDRRFLKSRYSPKGQGGALTWLRYEIKGDMPKNFTIEYDMDLGGPTVLMFSKWSGYGGQAVWIHASDETQVKSSNANGKLPVKTGIQHVAIAVSGTQVKVYVAGERVLSDPDGVVRPITRLGIEFQGPYREEGDHQMITNVRIAEGGKPAKQMLAG
jgi:hypothetical protein